MKNLVCMNCGSANLQRFLDLGNQPNGNHFPGQADFASEPVFPFAMAVCNDCWQVQLQEFPPMDFMFSNHPYVTGVNMPVVSHFERMVGDICAKYPQKPGSLVIDIGCNDGTLLTKFAAAGMRTLGVDPSQRTAELARKNGISVCQTFWDEQSAGAIKRLNLRPDLITATAVFYHVPDLHGFVRGLAAVMEPHTVFVAQCVYLKDVLEKRQFDHFYHEHTMIHAIAPLEAMFAKHGLRMLDVAHYDIHGGSFVLYVGRDDGAHATQPSIAKYIEAEHAAGLQSMEVYRDFARQVEQNRTDLVALLTQLRAEGKRVYALGAPLKGSTLLNYCGIGPGLVELATEVNRFKIGQYTPGTHIPIVDEATLDAQPDYYLVLSWNFLDFFVRKYEKYLRGGGKFIVPNPVVRVVGAEALD